MAAPTKPWERAGINYQNSPSFPSDSMSSLPFGEDRISTAAGGSVPTVASTSAPPHVPPRPNQQSHSNRYSPGIGYSSYGGNSFGGYNSYSSPLGMGGYGGMYSSYGGYGHNQFNDQNGSSFARHAEESSRPAFESIESIVHAVTSVGMMLDSTFQAVYNSFRAVIGVADNFSRLKSQLVQVISALAFIRTLRYLYRRVLEILRLRPRGEADKEWKHAFQEATFAAAGPFDGSSKKSTWPIILFFGIIMGGPYLIWKFLSKFSGAQEEMGWSYGKEDHYVAKANYSFQGQGSDELSFSAGQLIRVAPKEIQPRVRGWLLASVDGKATGMIPANYVTVMGRKRGSQHTDQSQQQHTNSTMSLTQESELSSGQLPSLPNEDLEKEFSLEKRMPNIISDVQMMQEMENQDAADILNSADKD